MDTFTRAFYREFGLNPSDYMKRPVPVTFFIPYGAKYRELRKENIDVSNIQPIFIQVVRKPERLCIIKRGIHAEDYCEAIRTVQAVMDSYAPAYLGYRWDDENPRIQLEPRGQRGYIELRAVRRVEKYETLFYFSENGAEAQPEGHHFWEPAWKISFSQSA